MTNAHWGFILAAYVVAVLVIGGMTLKILLDYRGLKRSLTDIAALNSKPDEAP